MRMPAFVAVSMGIAIAHAPETPVVTPGIGPVVNLHIEALRSIARGGASGFAAEWPSRAPQAFEYNGRTYHVLPCETGGRGGDVERIDEPHPAHRVLPPELLRRERVSPHFAPGGPGS